MEPTYTLAFDEAANAEAFLHAVANVKIAGLPIDTRRLNERQVEFVLGQPNVADEDFTVTIGNNAVDPADAGLANVVIDDEVGAAAYHVPEGMLLVYDPVENHGGKAGREPVSTTRIAPTLLMLQGVDPPAYMERPIEELGELAMEPA